MNKWVASGAMRLAGMAGCVALCVVLAGCTGPKSGDGPSEGLINMQRLMKLKNKYMSTHMGKSPANEEEFKKFSKGLKEADLKDLGITDLDAAFVSPRDKMPYVINYNAGGGMSVNPSSSKAKAELAKKMTSTKPPVFAYEAKGAGGKRFVCLAQGGSVMEVTEEEFNKDYAP